MDQDREKRWPPVQTSGDSHRDLWNVYMYAHMYVYIYICVCVCVGMYVCMYMNTLVP